ncbi:uncharacterized protein LOC124534063 [Vanessa cardui]|uniref:uncharacterized protein LOC124534063 n=1 Tax=Vanessa cardui TaxID=171605 RepID=UPI001F1354CF|nr:uncharacterized protein LOC124534063 [Vanessa cardui]
MFTFYMTIVAILVYSHNIHSLELVEVDLNNIFKNVDKQRQRIQSVDYRKPNADDLVKLIKRVIKGLSVDEKRSTKYKENILSLDEIQRSSEDFGKLSINENRNVKPHLFKLRPKQIAQNDQIEGQGVYKDIRNDRNDYSKVYLVLDPGSNLSSSDVKDISNLVSSLFTKSVHNKKATFKDRHKGIRRYKGFVIRDNRRRFKDKQEKFVIDSSKEDDYKPKRGRGGGGGGRTAIPYVRHRGDIYERD